MQSDKSSEKDLSDFFVKLRKKRRFFLTSYYY
jgi:hypothetical protein